MKDTTRLGKVHPIVGQQYLVGKTIGEGAFAKVKYGEHKRTREPVALKFLSTRVLRGAGLLDHTEQEIKITLQLKHPHIVEVKDVVVRKEKICIVMEYVDGGTLFDRVVRDGPLLEEQARRIFESLLGALDYCHDQGVFHRDLKPENMLLTRSGEVKLTDFGLSGFLTEAGGESGKVFRSTCGTPNYTAPEILQQQGYHGAPADIWSLGVVLYVMLVGRLPFAERTLSKLFRKIVSGLFEVPKSLSPDVKDLLRRILTPNPNNRIKMADIRKHPWLTKSAVSQLNCIEKTVLKKEDCSLEERRSVRKTLNYDSADENVMKRIKLDSKPRTKAITEDSAETIALRDGRVINSKHVRFPNCSLSDSAEYLIEDERGSVVCN